MGNFPVQLSGAEAGGTLAEGIGWRAVGAGQPGAEAGVAFCLDVAWRAGEQGA